MTLHGLAEVPFGTLGGLTVATLLLGLLAIAAGRRRSWRRRLEGLTALGVATVCGVGTSLALTLVDRLFCAALGLSGSRPLLPVEREAVALASVASVVAFARRDGERWRRLAHVGLSAVLAAGVCVALDLRIAWGPSGAALAAATLCATLLAPRRLPRLIEHARSMAVDITDDGMAVADPKGKVLWANAAARRALTIESGEAGGSAGDLRERALRRIQALLADPRRRHFRFRTRTGGQFEAWVERADAPRALEGARTLVVRDITRRSEAERRLRRLAHIDSLTGLPNRRFFVERLQRAVSEAQERGEQLALLYVDLDRFKEINDSVGHSAGDELLRIVGERFQRELRGDADAAEAVCVARLAGDEFAVLLPRLRAAEEAQRLAHRVLELAGEPIAVGERTIATAASIGVALFPQDGDSSETLVRNADSALYAAKRRGRGQVAFYDPSFARESERERALDQGIRAALERQEFRVHYQPKVDVNTQTVAGFEALLRWTSPELGTVQPSEFIPVAEARGLIAPVGEWCLREVVRQLAAWRAAGYHLVPVSVNVSSVQFATSDLRRVVTDALQGSGIEPRLLEIELTESALLEDRDQTILCLRELRAIGVRVALDDFGTGYSALSHLNNIPLDVLKMDRSLVREIENDATAANLTASVVAMARSVKLDIIAEGVDSHAQLELLFEMGCDQIQGFIYSPALPADEAARFLGNATRPARRIELTSKPDDSAEPEGLQEIEELPKEQRLLLTDDAAQTLAPVGLRLVRLGFDVHYARDADEAQLLLGQERGNISLVISTPAAGVAPMKQLYDWARRHVGSRPRWMVLGEEPSPAERTALREAGVDRVLWLPFEDAELSFVVAAVLASPAGRSNRRSTRVPVNLMAWLRAGSRRTVGVVANLSVTGAFIELSDPPPLGDWVRVELDLPGTSPSKATIFCHVVNRRDAADQGPSGIGVTFQSVDAATERAIRDVVEAQAARYVP